MDTERDVARGIQRQKVAQARANMAGGGGCILTGFLLAAILGGAGMTGLWAVGLMMLISLVIGGLIYQRVLTRNLNR